MANKMDGDIKLFFATCGGIVVDIIGVGITVKVTGDIDQGKILPLSFVVVGHLGVLSMVMKDLADIINDRIDIPLKIQSAGETQSCKTKKNCSPHLRSALSSICTATQTFPGHRC